MKMRSVMQHMFSRVPSAEIQRSSFDRSHGYKTTFSADYLIPILVDEALPGDTFNLRMSAFGRLATPIAPIMDNLFMDFFFFFVPYRLVWENWERFNGAQDDPGDSTDFLVPTTTAQVGGFYQGSVLDYMAVPTLVAGVEVSSLPIRAYRLIWNEWFRDENLQASLSVPTGDGPDALFADGVAVMRRGKRHDYFTSALPWPQKGDAVSLPLGTEAPVRPITFPTGVGAPVWYNATTDAYAGYMTTDAGGDVVTQNLMTAGNPLRIGGLPQDGGGTSNIVADLSEATAATINQLRQAFAVQKLLERDARGGTRYTEILRAHFGVVSPDARLQRPEYLGGGTTAININPVAQTSETATTPQGNLSGFGTLSAHGIGFTKSFVEHGVVIGIANARADLTYQQGVDRMWLRQTRYDFYWPALSHIGEQVVELQEIYATGTAADQNVFGYQERYAEYRYKPSHVTGLFRSNATGTLDYWHLAQEFGTAPALDSNFIVSDTPMARVSAVPDEPDFILDTYFNYRCARPMPIYGVPGFVDRF